MELTYQRGKQGHAGVSLRSVASIGQIGSNDEKSLP
jgi:hypothetical protein